MSKLKQVIVKIFIVIFYIVAVLSSFFLMKYSLNFSTIYLFKILSIAILAFAVQKLMFKPIENFVIGMFKDEKLNPIVEKIRDWGLELSSIFFIAYLGYDIVIDFINKVPFHFKINNLFYQLFMVTIMLSFSIPFTNIFIIYLKEKFVLKIKSGNLNTVRKNRYFGIFMLCACVLAILWYKNNLLSLISLLTGVFLVLPFFWGNMITYDMENKVIYLHAIFGPLKTEQKFDKIYIKNKKYYIIYEGKEIDLKIEPCFCMRKDLKKFVIAIQNKTALNPGK